MWADIARGEINAANFSLNDKWVPWYNIHKLYAGLRDAYLIAGNDKYLELAERFSHRLILDPLISKENRLTGMHANTQIPKVIGFQRYAEATNNDKWNKASEFFWDAIVDNWTVSIGGNSVYEHLHPPDDFSSMVSSNQGPETCNTYNMLRLSKLLYLADPGNKYMDYYERALYNHILSSKHPEGGYVYFTPMRPRHYRVYSQPHDCFWCCVGSGLENHGKYTEMIYLHDNNGIYVPVTRRWKNGDVITVSLPMKTRIEYLPDGSDWASILHGPVVLAAVTGDDDLDGIFADDGRWAHVAGGPHYPVDSAPLIVSTDRDFSNLIVPTGEKPMTFRIPDLIHYPEGNELTLVPFYEIHEARYMIYWPVITREELDRRVSGRKAEDQ